MTDTSPPEPRSPTLRAKDRLLRRLLEPVDVASLVYFRIAFAAIMVWECWRYLSKGRIGRYFIEPDFHFTYHGFEWVQPWPGDGMYVHFAVMAVLALMIGLGLLYRLAAFLFFLAFSYVFLLEQATYLNHFYFVILVSVTMIFVPAHRAFSLDAWRRGPGWRRETAPAWALWTLRAQMGFVYFYAGVAKLNGDWLRGYPLRDWLQVATDTPVIGPWLAEPEAAVFMAWSGMALDLLIVPALLWRPTRPYALAAALAFHALNMVVFSIGIFPHFSMAATLLFLDPDWPRRLLRLRPVSRDAAARERAFGRRARLAAGLACGWVAFQAVVPLRAYLYPGNPSWTEEGHRFSWHQKLRGKQGYVRFLLTDPTTGNSWTVDPRPLLTPRQYHKMVDRPYLILQLAHHLSELATEEGQPPVEVRASAMVGLNGREIQPFIDSSVDLAAQPKRFVTPHPWVLPLEVPLEAQWDGRSPPQHPVTKRLIEEHRKRFIREMEIDVAADGESGTDEDSE